MNFNPDNRLTLDNLLVALQSGLPGDVGYNIFQDVLSQQMAQAEARRARMQDFASTVIQSAASGMPREGTRAMLDIMTPRRGVPPTLQEMLRIAYPNPPLINPAQGPEMGRRRPEPVVPTNWGGGPNQTSPMYTPPPPEPVEATVGDVVTFIFEAKAQGKTDDEILQAIVSTPEAANVVFENIDTFTLLLPNLGAMRTEALKTAFGG